MRIPTDAPPRDHDAFESFYKDARDRLLLQTWALTSDLSAAQGAVRDAFVVGWHHWRKVRRLADDAAREDWVRPIAWQHAQRRHSVPHLHRDRHLSPELRATLTAAGKLPLVQRKALILAHLSTVSLEQLAREVGVPVPRAERELQAATMDFAALRGIPATGIREVFEPLAAYVAELRWPRPTIVMRAGGARRRTHTVAGALIGVAAMLGAGVVVAHGGSSHPSLDAIALHERVSPTPRPVASAPVLGTTALLAPTTVDASLDGSWQTALTSDSGTTTLPCTPRAAADKHATATLVRTFAGASKADVAGEAVEVSASPAAAQSAYTMTLGWYAGCTMPRLQLVSTQAVTGVGDDATVMGLRDWSAPKRSLIVGVARSGTLTTTVTASVPRLTTDALAQAPALLADALGPLCGHPGAGACVTTPATSPAAAPAAESSPGMLDAVDLPPASGVTQPWEATAPTAAKTNPAASHCDDTSFADTTRPLTRSFVITKHSPSVLFGVSETVGTLGSAKAATGFVDDVEKQLEGCAKRELGSKATRLTAPHLPGYLSGTDLGLWRVQVGSGKSSTTYLMALVQRGARVAQLSFIPAKGATYDTPTFGALALRAAERLGYL
jgi:DNA-directed RNA polymerase specialized sigma24 family protein